VLISISVVLSQSSCETTDMGLMLHHSACLFMPQILLELIYIAWWWVHGCKQLAQSCYAAMLACHPILVPPGDCALFVCPASIANECTCCCVLLDDEIWPCSLLPNYFGHLIPTTLVRKIIKSVICPFVTTSSFEATDLWLIFCMCMGHEWPQLAWDKL